MNFVLVCLIQPNETFLSVLTTVFAPIYIDITADSSHSSTPSLRIAQLITTLGTLSKALVG